MALLAGGGYAEQAVVRRRLGHARADGAVGRGGGAFPEVFLTAFLNIFMLGAAPDGGSVLVHGGGSGVGTAAITLCREAGLRIIVTAGSAEKCAALPRRTAPTPRSTIATATSRRRCARRPDDKGVDVVLDCIGGALPREQPRRARDRTAGWSSSA